MRSSDYLCVSWSDGDAKISALFREKCASADLVPEDCVEIDTLTLRLQEVARPHSD